MLPYDVIGINRGEQGVCSLYQERERSCKISRVTSHHTEPSQPTVTESAQLLGDNALVFFFWGNNGKNALTDWSYQNCNAEKLQGNRNIFLASTILWQTRLSTGMSFIRSDGAMPSEMLMSARPMQPSMNREPLKTLISLTPLCFLRAATGGGWMDCCQWYAQVFMC